MTDEEYSELLSLTRQNNQMLQEILVYVRKVDSPQFRDNETLTTFCMNLVANGIVERLFETNKTLITYSNAMNEFIEREKLPLHDNSSDALRTSIATAALQGLLASGANKTNSINWLCDRAIAYADIMISKLKQDL